MLAEPTIERTVFLSTVPPTERDRKLARAVVLGSFVAFVIAAPFANVKLAEVWPFIPGHQSVLVVTDLITATLLFAAFRTLGDRALTALASGYLFTALMAVVHALTFRRVFAPEGLLGGGPQTTAWLYMIWHAGFPLFVITYALQSGTVPVRTRGYYIVGACMVAVVMVVTAAVITTNGHSLLPRIMSGDDEAPGMKAVVVVVLLLIATAGLVLWRRRPQSLLDIWLIVVIWAWLFDIVIGVVLNKTRFDVGFYAGRLYGLVAASLVLTVLLVKTSTLYARTARSLEILHQQQLADTAARSADRLRRLLSRYRMPS